MAFYIKQNDTSPTLRASLTDYNGNSINITGATVMLHMIDLSGTVKVNTACTINDASGGIVDYEWVAGDTDTVGTYKAEWEVTYADSTVETFPNNGHETIVVTEELN